MQKQLTKFLKLSGKKKGDGDTTSISSKASVQGPSEVSAIQIFSYSIKKDKDLPKLHKAAWQGNISKVKELTKPSTVNVLDKKSRTPLHLACAQGDVNIATHLLSCKATKVNLCDTDGRTALMKAVDSNHCDCAKVLLDANSDANTADSNGLTPLHVAAHRGTKDIATLLLERDARITAIDKSGSTPLHYATLQGHNNFVSFLINEGADINVTDGEGCTPLMLAAAEGRIGILKILLQSKPDADRKDNNGCSAIDHAIINNNNNDIIQLIKDYQRSTIKSSKHMGKRNSMLIDDPKLALDGSNFRGPAVDNTDDLNDTKTEENSAKIDVASHNSWNSNDEEDSSQALPANNRGPSLLGALKSTVRQDHNPVQAPKGHSSVSRQNAVSSEGNPLISKPILYSASNPPTASNHPHQQQTLPTGRKTSEQSVEDFQLDSFDDTDSESEVEDKPTATIVNSTPSVTNKKLPGLSFSFNKAPFATRLTLPEEKEETQISSDKVPPLEVTLDKPASAMMDTPATKETKGLVTEKQDTVSVKKDDISSDFDSSPPLSAAEDDHFKHFDSDNEEDDDVLPSGYVPSVGIGNSLVKRSHSNSSTGHPQKLTTTQKEKDKILELAHSSLLEMEETSKKSDPPKSHLDKTDEGKDVEDSGTPSHNPGTFSPITPLADQPDGLGMFSSDAKPTNKKLLGSSATADHVVGVMSPSSGSNSSLDTDSVIRQAEEIERSVENPTGGDHEVQGKVATTAIHKKSDKQESEGSDWDSEVVDDEEDDTTSKSDSGDEGRNALAGLGTSGLPDPFISHSKRGSKSTSKPADYFTMYGSDSSEGDDDIEKLLSPEKNAEKHNKGPLTKTIGNGTKAVQAVPVDASIPANSTSMDHHSPPTSNNEHTSKHNDSAVKNDEVVELVNPLLDDKDDQQTTVEESESEWEKELKLKRDQKTTNQPSSALPSHQTIPVVDQKQAFSVDDKQLFPTDNSSVSEVLTNEPSSEMYSDNREQAPLENNNSTVTQSLKDDTNIQDDGVDDKHSSPEEASSTLPLSPATIKDMEATKRYEQKQNELLLVLEGRRKQLGKDKTGDISVRSSSRVDEELAHIRRPSISELRSTWEGQQQVSSNIMPPLHSKMVNKVELELIKSSPKSLPEANNSDHLLDRKSAVTDVATTKDQALFQQPVLLDTSGNTEILFSKEEEKESDALPQNVTTHLEHSAMPSQLVVKSLELEKQSRAANTDEQRQRSLLSQSEQSSSSNKSVESPSGEVTEQGKQFKTGKLVEDEDDKRKEHVSSDILASTPCDQWTTPTNERITNDNGIEKHPTDDSDDIILNGSISLSSQHTITELSTTHSVVSPIPFLSSSLPRPSSMTSYGRPASSLLESSGVNALQENLRKTQIELERAQSAEAHAKTGKKRMEAQLKESYRKQSDLSALKAQLEESKLDLEMENRSMSYQLEQETIARKNAESLVDQYRQQLSKLDQQLREEKESHQKALSQKKEAELNHRTLFVSTRQLQERLDDVQTRLQRERDSWKLQDTLYNERLKVFQDIQEESNKSKERQAQVLTQLEESDVMQQSLMEKHSTVQQQLVQAQVQLSREQQQHEELQLQLTAELEATNSKLTTKSNSLVEAEKALLQLQQQFDNSLTELKSKAEMLSTRLDEEVANKKQAETELSVMRTQHEKTNNELHTALKEKLQLEKEQHMKEQEYLRQTNLLERDLASSQEKQQEMVEKLQSMELKLTSSENEGKNLQSRLFEQANQVNIIQREADHNQQLLAATEEKLRRENELRIKLEGQLAMVNEKSTSNQSELVFLRAQLDVANKKLTDKDTQNSETQDKFSLILDNLKTDHQQVRNVLEEKLQSLRDQLMVAKEEIARGNSEKSSLSKEIVQLREELEKYAREKQTLEKTLVQTKEMSSTDRVSQADLQHQIQVLNSKLVASEDNFTGCQKSCEDLQEQLAEQQQQYDELQEELALSEQECATLNEEKLELEESVSALTEEVERCQDDLSKKDEQIVQLNTQLKHLQDVRSGLEQTTTLLRGEIHELESQLTHMTVDRDKALTSAEESKGLWETEIKSRSQLGLKLMQLQKSHSDHAVVLDNEKRKARKALEMKKNVERKMEFYQERNTLLQEELVSLKSQLKSAKKKLKEFETSESSVKAELDRVQQLLQSETDSLRAQLLKVSTELRTESLLRKEAENSVTSLKRECDRSRSQLSLSKTELREKEKVHRHLGKANKKLKEDLDTLKEEVLKKYTPISELEVYKIQIEDKAKRELQAKLEEVNSHLEQQSTVQAALDKLRSETELQWQSRYEQTTEELKYQLKKALSEVEELRVQRDTKDAEARRYKELFEVESQRREKLSSKLEVTREPTDHPSNQEQKPQHLFDNGLSSRNLPCFPTSPLKSSTNDLLSSVRQELDKSIAKHLESVSSTTQPQLKYHRASQSAPRRDSARVTAIAQNYFV